MPRSRPHGTDASEEPEGIPARRRHGPRPTAGSMHEAEEGVVEYSEGGRSTADGGTGPHASGDGPASPRPETDDLLTQGTARQGGIPDGRPTVVQGRPDVSRSLEMENSAAVTIADAGYRIQQNPTKAEVAHARQATGDTGDPGKDPDYLLEGRVFDCYSPTTPDKAERGIWKEAMKKVDKGQTQRVVVNLEDWRGDMSALRRQFADWPIPGLKEVKAITPDGDIVQIDLPPASS